MNITNESAQSQTTVARLPLWLQFSGTVIFVGSVMLSARLIWEQTVWTWERGPQMVGFSLAHGAGAILLIFPLLLFIWTAVVIVLTLRSKIKKMEIAPARWAALGLVVLLLVLGELPDGFWQRVFIRRMATSPRAGDLLVYAAYRGDFGTVRGFTSHGVPVDSIDHSEWRTALHGAAAKGDTQTLRYLVSKGANINALDRSGDSPLELAASRGNQEAAQFLIERGAERIRGDEAQRQKAIHDKVQDDIKELNRAEGLQP
jgi:Ankyrin repeats (many copies)